MSVTDRELKALHDKVHAPLQQAAGSTTPAPLANTSPLAITAARIGSYVVIVNEEIVGYFPTAALAATEAARYPTSLAWQVGVPRGIAPIHPH